MKILHVGLKNYPPSYGGVETVIYNISNENSEFDFYFLTEWENEKQFDNVEMLPKGVFNKLIFIFKFIKSNSIDLINFHKETYCLYTLFFSIMGYNTILTFHGLAWRLSRWSYLYRAIFFIMDILACLSLNRIVFVSESDMNYYEKILFWKKFYYIPNGVNCDEDFIDNSEGLRFENLCYLGRLSPEKNLINLIKASNFYKIKLDIYGPMDKRDKNFQKIMLRLIDNSQFCKWKGTVDTKNVYKVLRQYNVLINPSYSEGMPVSVLEAAANKCYLVLSNIISHKNLEFPDVFYIDCDQIDFSNLNLKSISEKNFKHVRERYSTKVMRENYNTLYKDER